MRGEGGDAAVKVMPDPRLAFTAEDITRTLLNR